MSQQLSTRKKTMLNALIKSLGVVTEASKKAKIDRTTHYLWMNTDPEYKRQVEDIDNMVIDFAETSLHKQIKEGNTTATIFYLKTKGKKRGYTEKPEVKETDFDNDKKLLNALIGGDNDSTEV